MEVGPAALPGSSKRLATGLVMARVRHAGVDTDGLAIKGARAVRATTMHQEVSSDMVEQSLRRFILGAMPWDAQATTIEVTGPAQVLVVGDGRLGFQWRSNPDYRYLGSGAFRGEVTVDEKPVKSLLCRVDVRTYGPVLVAVEDVPRGRPLSPAMVEIQERELSTLREAALSDPAEAARCTTRRNVYAGQVITASLVAPRVVIKRRQVVPVEMRAGCLVVRARARAESDGAEGDVIACTNLNSKQPFYGIVRGDGTVVVQ